MNFEPGTLHQGRVIRYPFLKGLCVGHVQDFIPEDLWRLHMDYPFPLHGGVIFPGDSPQGVFYRDYRDG